MDIMSYDGWFICGFLASLVIVFILWLIYRYYKWVEKVNDKLIDHQWKLNRDEESIDNLKVRVNVLEYRAINTSYNEEGIGSINPSEADTE